MSQGGGQSEDQPPSFSGDDDFNNETPPFAAQSSFARSLYEIPSQGISNLLEARNRNFTQNLNFHEENERTGVNGNSDIFQDIHSFSSPGQNQSTTHEQPTRSLSSNATEHNRYLMTQYELSLYEQYARKDEEAEEDRGDITASNTHGLSSNNHNDISAIANQLNNLHVHNDIRSSADVNQHVEALGSSIRNSQGQTTLQESPQALQPASSIENDLQTSSLDLNVQPNHRNKPAVFEGKQQQIFPPPIYLVNPTAIRAIEIREKPLTCMGSRIEVPECMIAELIDETLSHTSASRSKTYEDFEKHAITCVNCYRELRVHKLVSLVSCPNCEAVFPNSCFGRGIRYMNGNRNNESVARKYIR